MRILCFGDSNTWGYDGQHQRRIEQRWPVVLAKLRERDTIIEAGLNGRTTSFDDPFDRMKNGKRALPMILKQTQPLDLLIFMLGTNDMKCIYNASHLASAKGMRELIRIAQNKELYEFAYKAAQILVIAPAPLHEEYAENEHVRLDFGRRGYEESHRLKESYRELAKAYGCLFLDAGAFVKPDPYDCIHINEEGHQLLAHKIAELLCENGFPI